MRCGELAETAAVGSHPRPKNVRGPILHYMMTMNNDTSQQIKSKVDPEISDFSGGSRVKVLVALPPQQSRRALSILESAGSTIIEHLAFIETYFVELPTDALQTLAVNPAVLHIGYEGYHPIVKGIEYAIQKRQESRIRVMNMSIGPFHPHDAKPFVANDPVNLATKHASEQGIVVVVAAGNRGPKNSTLNPWAAAPWVIGVGAAEDQMTLADFSSRGDPGDLIHIPTVVAVGVGFKFEGKPIPPGTSFSAPQISFIAIVCIEFIETFRSFMGKNPLSVVVGTEYGLAMLDTGIDSSRLTRKFRVPGGRCRVLSGPLRAKLGTLQEFLRSRDIPYAVSATPKTIKKMFQAMATPMGRKPHEAGAGFCDEKTVTRYMCAFGAKSFVQLFALRNLTVREEEELNKLDQQLGPFSSESEVEMIFTFCDAALGIVDIRVVKK